MPFAPSRPFCRAPGAGAAAVASIPALIRSRRLCLVEHPALPCSLAPEGRHWRVLLQALVDQARTMHLLSPLSARQNLPSISVYADDAVLFFRPTAREALVIKAILGLFGDATGLKTNFSKSAITPIHCSADQLSLIEETLSCRVENFPITYLGLPLGTRKPTKAELQPILDKLAKKVAGWKPKMLSIDGRLCLIKSVLMALPVHFLSVLQLPRWAIKDIERKCRGF